MIGNQIINSIGSSFGLGDIKFDFDTKQIIDAKRNADELVDSMQGLDEVTKESAKSNNSYSAAAQISNMAMAQGATNINIFSNGLQNATIKQKLFNAAVAVGSTILKTIGAAMVVTIATGFVTWLWDVAHAEERVAEAAEKAKNNIKDLNDDFTSQKSIVDEAIKSYDKLSEGINKVNNENVSLSTEDYEKFLDLNNQLVDIFPELYGGIDENGNAILNFGNSGETAAEKLQSLLDTLENIKNVNIAEQLPDLAAGLTQQFENLQEQTDKLEDIDKIRQLIANQMNNPLQIPSRGMEGRRLEIDLPEGSDEYISILNQSAREFYNKLDDESRRILSDPETGLGFDPNNLFKTIINSDGSQSVYADIFMLNDTQRADLQKIIADNTRELGLMLDKQYAELLAEQKTAQREFDSSYSSLISSTIQGLNSSESPAFTSLDDNTKDTVKAILNHMSDSMVNEMANYKDSTGEYNPIEWVENNIISSLNNLSDSDLAKVNDAYANLLNFNLEDSGKSVNEASDYVNNWLTIIATILNKNKDELATELGFDDLFQLNENIDKQLGSSIVYFRKKIIDELNQIGKDTGFDFTLRPEVDTTSLQNAGWEDPKNAYVQTYTNEDGSQSLVVTPILPDGTVLSPTQLQDYVNKLFSGQEVEVPILIDTFNGEDSQSQAQTFAQDVGSLVYQYGQGLNGLRAQLTDFFDEHIKSQDAISVWEDVKNGANDATDAIEKCNEQYSKLNDSPDFNPTSLINTVTQLNGMRDAWDSVNAVYKEYKTNLANGETGFSVEGLSGVIDSFKEINGVDVEGFLSVLSDSSSTAEDVQNAFNQLATEYVYASGCLNGLTEATAEQVTKELELQGITNASAIVQEYLSYAQQYTAATGKDLANTTAQEVFEFINLSTTSDQAAQYVSRLQLSKMAVNNTQINTASDIEQIVALANTAGASAASLYKLQAAMAVVGNTDLVDPTSENYDPYAAKEGQRVLNDLATGEFWDELEYEPLDASEFIKPVFGGSKEANSGGGGSKDQKEQFDWIETRLQRIKEKRDELSNMADSPYENFLGITQEDLARAKELFNMQISPGMSAELDELFEIAQRAGVSIGELQAMVEGRADANSRDSYMQQVLLEDKKLIETNKLAIAEYQSEYDRVKGLVSPETQAKIESGDINIEEYSGEQAENIKTVQDAYEKLNDARIQQNEYERQYTDDLEKSYQNRIDYIDAQNSRIESSNELIKSQMDYLEESGQIVSAISYEQLIANIDRQIAQLEKRKKEQEAQLEAMLNDPNSDLEENSPEYLEMKDAIDATEAEIIDLRTAQEEYNNTLLMMPVNNMDTLLNMYKSITTEIENWGAEVEASGKKLDQNYYQTLINNGMDIIDQYEEQAELVKDVMDEYDEGSDKWNEMYDKLTDINSEMSSMVQNLYEWNEALLQIPIDNMNAYVENLQQISDAMSETMSEYNTVIDAVVGAIDAEIEAINDEKDEVNETYQDRIDALQDQLDLLDEQNEKKQLQLDLEQAQYELEQLRSQKTIRVIRSGRIQYETDQDAINEAQQAVDDAEFNIKRQELEDQIDALQDELDKINEGYDDQIERLEEMSNKWEEIRTNVEQYNKELVASDYLGDGWQDKVISGNDQDIYEMFKGMYEKLNEQQNAYNEQIDTTQNISELLSSYIAAYKEGTITYQEAARGIKDVLSQINTHTTALDNLQNVLDYSGVVNNTAGNAESVLKALQTSLKQTSTEFIKSFETYNKNAGLITEYTSSWDQLTSDVSDIKDTIEDVRDNLEDAARDRDDDDDDDGDGAGGHWDSDFPDGGPGVYAKGIEKGLVGSNTENDRENKMKMLGLKELDPDEIRAIIHKGEAVFNPEQQNQLLRNFANAYNMAMPNITMPSIPEFKQMTMTNDINITLGDINLPDVSDADGFARAMGTRFGAILKQELGKNLR